VSNSNGTKATLNTSLVLSGLMSRSDLPDVELRVALKILSRRDDTNAWCQIAQSTLADYMRIPQQTVNRIVAKLRVKKILESTWTYDLTTHRRGSAQYFFLADLHLLNRMIVENSLSSDTIGDLKAVKEKLKKNTKLSRKKKPK
jgi:hypothetical protein